MADWIYILGSHMLAGILVGVVLVLAYFRMGDTAEIGWEFVKVVFSILSSSGVIVGVRALFNGSDAQNGWGTLLLLAALLGSAAFTFFSTAQRFRADTKNASIRVLDVVMGVRHELRDYRDDRKKEIDESLGYPRLQERSEKLDSREAVASRREETLRRREDELKELEKGKPLVMVPVGFKLPITNARLEAFYVVSGKMVRFEVMMRRLTAETVASVRKAREYELEECVKAYLTGICILVLNQLVCVTDSSARVHMRMRGGEQYNELVAFLAAASPTKPEKAMRGMPYEGSLIARSYETCRSLVASANPSDTYETHGRYDDFLTYAFREPLQEGMPLLTMGISIRKGHALSDVLYCLSYMRFEEAIEDSLHTVLKECDIAGVLANGLRGDD